MKLKSIRIRVLSGIWALLLFAVVPPVLYFAWAVHRDITREANTEAVRALDLALWMAREHAPFTDQKALSAWAEDYGKRTGHRLTFLMDGHVAADSAVGHPGLAGLDSHEFRPEVLQARKEGLGVDRRMSVTLHQEMIYVARPMEGLPGLSDGVMRLAVPTSGLRDRFENLSTAVLAVLAFCFVLSGVISYFALRPMVNGLVAIAEAAEDIGRGNYARRIRCVGWKELCPLAEGINSMAEGISRQLKELASRGERLSAVFNTMREGVIVLDKDGRIEACNKAAEYAFGGRLAKGETLLEATMQPALQRALDQAAGQGDAFSGMAGESPAHGKAVFALPGDREFEASVVSLRHGEGQRVVVFYDISEHRRLDRMRRDFVANVSHELKTPLTSIIGYTETLLDGEHSLGEQERAFLTVVLRNAEHMSRIVKSLLVLAKAEHQGESRASLVPVNPLSPMSEALAVLAPLAESRSITVTVAEESVPNVMADKDALTEVVHNLLDNAIRYTQEGGRVDLWATPAENSVILRVEDNGPSIPEEARDRVFERFFRLGYPQLGQKNGGAGLGLAICRRIVKSLGGEIWLETPLDADANTGVAFCVSLRRERR